MFSLFRQNQTQTEDRRKPTETVCVHRWNYLIVNFKSGSTRTCCLTPKRQIQAKDLKDYGTDVFLNTQYLKNRREELLLGIDHPDCGACTSLEKKGVYSKRTPAKAFHQYFKDTGRMKPESEVSDIDRAYKSRFLNRKMLTSNTPEYVEIVLGNQCDLKCTYCNHYYSSQWVQERMKFGELSKEMYQRDFPSAPEGLQDAFWSWLEKAEKSHLRQINILGGEPLIIPEFPDVVDRLIDIFSKEKGRPELGIVTNFNAKPEIFEKFMGQLERLSKHFYVHLQPSMETLGSRAEYIRFNLSWERFNSNIHQLLDRREDLGLDDKNFFFSFQSALNTLSVSSLPRFMEWLYELSLKYDTSIGMGSNVVTDPATHDCTYLTSDFASYIKEARDFAEKYLVPRQREKGYHRTYFAKWEFYNNNVLPPLYDYLKNKDNEWSKVHGDFVYFIEENDFRRGSNFFETFPEYENYFEFCKSKEYTFNKWS